MDGLKSLIEQAMRNKLISFGRIWLDLSMDPCIVSCKKPHYFCICCVLLMTQLNVLPFPSWTQVGIALPASDFGLRKFEERQNEILVSGLKNANHRTKDMCELWVKHVVHRLGREEHDLEDNSFCGSLLLCLPPRAPPSTRRVSQDLCSLCSQRPLRGSLSQRCPISCDCGPSLPAYRRQGQGLCSWCSPQPRRWVSLQALCLVCRSTQ